MQESDESGADRYFIEATGNAIRFLQSLELDETLRNVCSAADLDGRLRIAYEKGYEFLAGC